eukprot:s5345_g2.t1
MSYLLRGFGNTDRAQRQRRPPPIMTFDPATREVEWEHFKGKLGTQWRGLKPQQIFEIVKFSHSDKNDSGRFELRVLHLPQRTEVHGIREFQGRCRNLVSEETDMVDMHRDSYALCDGYTPTLLTRPPVGVSGCCHGEWDRLYPVGYHATYSSNFANIVCTGLIPGGVTLGGSTGRAFTMMACLPQWARPNNAGLRPGAEVEFAIDLHLTSWKGAREAYLRTGELLPVFNSDLIDRVVGTDANCILDFVDRLYPIDNKKLGWAEFVGHWIDVARPSHLREEGIFDVNGRTVQFEPGGPLEGTPAEWTLNAQVWFSSTCLAHERHQRTDRSHYSVNFNVGFPKIRCPGDRCRFQMLDVTYLAELADLRAEASHAGSTQGLHYLAPKASINASPHNHQGQGEDVKKGIAATLKHKCKKMVTKAAGSRYGSLYGSVTYEPFTAFNIMSKGMTISCLEEVEMFARIRIPAPGRGTDAKPGFAGSHTSDARAAYIFPAFDDAVNSRYEYKRTLAIELARHCYFCFQDRFYLVPEIAVLIRATQIAREMRHMNPFTILARDRDCARNHG